MFKIVHSGGRHRLAVVLYHHTGTGNLFLILQPDAVYLVFCGLINLLAAGLSSNNARTAAQTTSSVLIVSAVVLQAFVVFAPLPLIAGQPGVVLSLAALVGAAVLQLTGSLPARRKSSTSFSGDQGNRETGTVKWFNTLSKGFGFISRDSGDDIFVHFRAIRGEGHRVLVEGQRVEFAVMQRDKGR